MNLYWRNGLGHENAKEKASSWINLFKKKGTFTY